MKILKNKRGDISSPIIVVLVTVTALAIAGIAIAWMTSTGLSATRQGSIIVLGTPILSLINNTHSNLFITLKNIGNVPVKISEVRIGNATSFLNTSLIINPGNTDYYTIIMNLSINSSQSYNGILITSAGTIPFIAYCQ
ncbi:MAG: hypothetical protein QXY96_04505 [Candidatus Methanomethylicaceae archaeon]